MPCPHYEDCRKRFSALGLNVDVSPKNLGSTDSVVALTACFLAVEASTAEQLATTPNVTKIGSSTHTGNCACSPQTVTVAAKAIR